MARGVDVLEPILRERPWVEIVVEAVDVTRLGIMFLRPQGRTGNEIPVDLRLLSGPVAIEIETEVVVLVTRLPRDLDVLPVLRNREVTQVDQRHREDRRRGGG